MIILYSQFLESDIKMRMYYGITTWKPIMTWQSSSDHQRLRILEVFEYSRDVAGVAPLIRSFIAPYYLVLALSHDRSVFARMPNFSPLWKQSDHSFGLPGLDVDTHDAIGEQTPRVQSRLGVAASRRRKREREIDRRRFLSPPRCVYLFFSREERDEIFCFGAGSYYDVRPEGTYRFHLVALTWKKNFSHYSSGFVELMFGDNVNENDA